MQARFFLPCYLHHNHTLLTLIFVYFLDAGVKAPTRAAAAFSAQGAPSYTFFFLCYYIYYIILLIYIYFFILPFEDAPEAMVDEAQFETTDLKDEDYMAYCSQAYLHASPSKPDARRVAEGITISYKKQVDLIRQMISMAEEWHPGGPVR